MKKPRFWRNVWIVVALAGLAAGAVAFSMPDGGRGFTLQVVLGLFGMIAAPVAIVAGWMAVDAVKRFDRLDRGEGVIARWTIDPPTWARFAVLNRQRQGTRRANVVHVPDTIAQPVDIVVARDAIRIDRAYHVLDKGALDGMDWVPGPPGTMELNFSVPGKSGRSTWSMRFPVARGAEAMAQRVFDQLGKAEPLGPIA